MALALCSHALCPHGPCQCSGKRALGHPRGTYLGVRPLGVILVMSRGIFSCHDWRRGNATAIRWVGSRDAAQHLGMHKIAPTTPQRKIQPHVLAVPRLGSPGLRPRSQTFSVSWQGQGPFLLCQDISSVRIPEKQAEVCVNSPSPPQDPGSNPSSLLYL